MINLSPVVALNRAIAIAQRDGPECGLKAIAAIEDRARLASYPFYPAAIGELELRRGRYEAARGHFQAARELARNPMERRFLDQRMNACEHGETQHLGYYEEFWNQPIVALKDYLEGKS